MNDQTKYPEPIPVGLGKERFAAQEEEQRKARTEHARKARALEVAQLAATIYSGFGVNHNNIGTVRDAVAAARALLAEAERTEP